MTIDQLITFLQQQRETLGGDATVVAEWDSGFAEFKYYHTYNKLLILEVPDYASGEPGDIDYKDYREKQTETTLMVPE